MDIMNPKSKHMRFVSQLSQQTVAVILAGGRGEQMGKLTDWRPKPAMPFAGKFRLIDFAMSNCLNSHIDDIVLLTQYKSYSLIKHVRNGWIRRSQVERGGINIVPAQQWVDEQTWYRGSADAVYQSLDIIKSYQHKYVMILAGDHVYNFDYGQMLTTHMENEADVTICASVVPRSNASRYGVLEVEENGLITSFEEMPEHPKTLPHDSEMSLASMGVYVFNTDLLEKHLKRDAKEETQHNLGRDIIPTMLTQGAKLQVHLFNSPLLKQPPYWNDISTIDAYYRANMELLSEHPPIDLYHSDWPIMTDQSQLPPARFCGSKAGCKSENSMVSGGCNIVNSVLENSILFSDVTVLDDCRLSGVLALPGCQIGVGSKLTNVILDDHSVIEPGTVIGENLEEDRKRYTVTDGGVVLVSNFKPGYYDDRRSGNLY